MFVSATVASIDMTLTFGIHRYNVTNDVVMT